MVDTITDEGEDEEGATTVVSLEIVGGDGTDSNLNTTDGSSIDLFEETNGDVTGRTGGDSGLVIFAISIDGEGQVSVAQYDSIEHDPNSPNSHDESVDLAGKLNAVVTVTDGDNDVATDSKEIGSSISFQDDGPTASISATGNTVTLDETVGSTTDTPDDDIDDGNSDPFGATYGSAIGAVSDVNMVDTTTTEGEDDEGATTVVSLDIVGGDGSDSGLATTDGTTINLYEETNGDVTGRTGSDSGEVIFAISIDGDGEVNVAQYDSLEHPTSPNEHDESVNLTGKLDAVVTVTDGDGDVATDSTAIGSSIVFEDDGPTAGNVDDDVSEIGPLVATGFLDFDFGADGGSITEISRDSDGDNDILVDPEGRLQIDGFIGTQLAGYTLSVNVNTGFYTYTLSGALTGDDIVDVFNFTVTDGDLDTVEGTLTINVDVFDNTQIISDISSGGTLVFTGAALLLTGGFEPGSNIFGNFSADDLQVDFVTYDESTDTVSLKRRSISSRKASLVDASALSQAGVRTKAMFGSTGGASAMVAVSAGRASGRISGSRSSWDIMTSAIRATSQRVRANTPIVSK